MIPRTLLSFLLLALMIGAAQGVMTRSQHRRATSSARRTLSTITVKRKPGRTPGRRKALPQPVILPEDSTDNVPLEDLDDPVERFERLILTTKDNDKDSIGSFGSLRYQSWMSELRWAEDALYVLVPMSIIDLRLTFVTHRLLKGLLHREKTLRGLLNDALSFEKKNSRDKSPPFPFTGNDVNNFRISYRDYRRGRMILPAIPNEDQKEARIIPAYGWGICSSKASFDLLLPNGYHISVVGMVALRRINAWIKREIDQEKREARKAEGEKFRAFILAYIKCYHEAVQWEIDPVRRERDVDQMKMPSELTRVDKLLDTLVKATEIDANASDITEAFGSIRDITAETRVPCDYGKQHDPLLNEVIGSETKAEATAWEEWTALLKVTFDALYEPTLKWQREYPFSTKMAPASIVTSSLDPEDKIDHSVAGNGICAYIQHLLDLMEGYLPKASENIPRHHRREFLKRIPQLKGALPLLPFRLMQMHPSQEIDETWYMADEWMQPRLTNWERTLDGIEESMKARSLEEAHTILAKLRLELLDFCAPKRPSQEVEHPMLYEGHQEGLTTEQVSRFNNPLKLWKSRTFSAVLGEAALMQYTKNLGLGDRRWRLTGRKVRALMMPEIEKKSKVKSLTVLDKFLARPPARFEGMLSEREKGYRKLASTTYEFIDKKIWKSLWTESERKQFSFWIIRLLLHVDDVIEEVRRRAK